MESKTFAVANISCGHCVKTIEEEVSELGGVVKVTADNDSKQVSVQWDAPANEAVIRELLDEIGYPAA